LNQTTDHPPGSPIVYFRRLLALSEADRERELAAKPESQRKVLREKLVEYTLLPPEERDARLQVLQLKFYLLPLMEMPSNLRSNRLAAIPSDWRAVVQERLKDWDILPPPLQQRLLLQDSTRNYFVRLEASTPDERKAMLAVLPPHQRQVMEQGLEQWRALAPDQRQKIFARLDQYLQMTPQDKNRILGELPEADRQEMEQTLRTFQTLPKAERERCLESFQKFAAMSPPERDQFLANVERWKEMSPEERQTWRDLVNRLPPLPPGFNPQPLPPLPEPLSAAADPPNAVDSPKDRE
jgi:predicted Fe-S protein YdhL (DUF1289 family)